MSFAGVDAARLLHEGMRVAAMNHTIIANNIANADTPNFNPTKLDFQATLRNALEGRSGVQLRRTHARHLDAKLWNPAVDRKAVMSKNDFNKVDLDEEMNNLSVNYGKYNVYGSLLAKKFRQVKDMLSQLR